jgi:hypothetical protein
MRKANKSTQRRDRRHSAKFKVEIAERMPAPESVQLVCKVMKVHTPGKPARLAFHLPKPKPE